MSDNVIMAIASLLGVIFGVVLVLALHHYGVI
jgi:hypothetical protein